MSQTSQQTSTKPRPDAPTECTTWQDHHPFRVWFYRTEQHVEHHPWTCVATFRFLGDCLDYIADKQDKGVDVVYQSPDHTKPVLATDPRVVHKNHAP